MAAARTKQTPRPDPQAPAGAPPADPEPAKKTALAKKTPAPVRAGGHINRLDGRGWVVEES